MADEFEIGGQRIERESRITVDIPLPNLYTHTQVALPVRVVRGKRDGPRLLISAALHGDEINGVEIIRRLLVQPVLSRLRGVLIAVPVVNVYGFLSHSRYLPDRRDLNRAFPGSDRGSLTARLAHVFLRELVSHATHGIDLHTGALHRSNLPQIRTHAADPELQDMARAFGAPVILDSIPPEGSYRQAARAAGLRLILFEGGEALRFDELAVRAGVQGIMAVMRHLGMLPRTRARTHGVGPVVARSSYWVRAPQSGILRAARPLGSPVDRDGIVAVISDPFGERETQVLARQGGIIIGRTHLPLVTEGDALFHVARIANAEGVEGQFESYQDELADMRELADPFNPAESPDEPQ